MRKSAIRVLRRARRLVARPDGWTQHTSLDRAGRVCAIGAIFGPLGCVFDIRRYEAFEAVNMLVPPWLRTLSTWNDAPGRTQDDVVALFDTAIGIELAGGI